MFILAFIALDGVSEYLHSIFPEEGIVSLQMVRLLVEGGIDSECLQLFTLFFSMLIYFSNNFFNVSLMHGLVTLTFKISSSNNRPYLFWEFDRSIDNCPLLRAP